MFPAANEDHIAIDRLSRIPPGPFKEMKIPNNPRISIGSNEYPRVLITPYNGTISFYLKLEVPGTSN